MKASKTFEREYDALQNLFVFLKEYLQKCNVSRGDLFELELTAEEIFMNMVRHNTSTIKPIEVSVQKKGKNVVLCFTDHEKTPFDITKANEVDFDDYLKKRKSGGLGIHLIRKYMDDVSFEHADGVSKITITKKI